MTIVIIFSHEFPGIPSEWHTVWILIRPTVLTVFIQIQTVFKLSLAGNYDVYWGWEIAETGMDIRPVLQVAIVDIMGIDILAQWTFQEQTFWGT